MRVAVREPARATKKNHVINEGVIEQYGSAPKVLRQPRKKMRNLREAMTLRQMLPRWAVPAVSATLVRMTAVPTITGGLKVVL